MRRNELFEILASHREVLDGLGVTKVLVFGSVARDEARSDSDVDLIVEFNKPIGYLGLARAQREFEMLLGCRVDLATRGMIRKELRDRIYAEAVRAA